MAKLYQSPLRVYLALGCLALFGIICGLNLPVSLFPNSSKPTVGVSVPYGYMTSDEFLNTYGTTLEDRLRAVSFEGHTVDHLEAQYGNTNVTYRVKFKWGTPSTDARKEVQSVVNAFSSQFPQEMRDGTNVWMWNQNSGFFALSFYSDRRSLDDLFKYLDPLISPISSGVPDAQGVGLWNPAEKEIKIELDPEKMAVLQLVPNDVANAITPELASSNAGSVNVGLQKLRVTLPRDVNGFSQLGNVLVATPGGKVVHLNDIATIDFDTPLDRSQIVKTSGAPSVILFAQPKPGGNVKRMSEDIIAAVHKIEPSLPPDIHYKMLVDPSEFIRAATDNVLHEVFLAALLAVAVLFLFIGNIKNVITAAIEIPFSIVLAFILMRLSGMNMNLISLGGLALSAGMNVDASVVVMENIFRHFELKKGVLTARERVDLVMKAVAEVRFPVIASTIASLVVFIPLAFTSDLTNAILGDLALAVVFSHGFSALVALILVPTVRLHLMTKFGDVTSHSPIESWLKALEKGYSNLLKYFLFRPRLKMITYASLGVILAVLVGLVLPKLPKEIVGTPDTDWLYIDVSCDGNTLTKQMESQAEELEDRILKKYGDKIQYTFTQIEGTNYASVMARLKDKKEFMAVRTEMEKEFQNTPMLRYSVSEWNPSEMPIPNPQDLEIAIRGRDAKDRVKTAQEVKDLIEDKKAFSGLWTSPGIDHTETVFLRPNMEQWMLSMNQGLRLRPSDLADLSRVATTGHYVGHIMMDGTLTNINIAYPPDRISSIEDLESLPVGIGGRLVPLRALVQVSTEEVEPTNVRIDGRSEIQILGRVAKDEKDKLDEYVNKSVALVDNWNKHRPDNAKSVVTVEDPKIEMNEALRQLMMAVGLSILLIFMTMVFQFGDVVNSLLVLVAIPLGFIGVVASLYVFKSTLSLNSVLGIILLNGIAVANSIMLVDVLKRLAEEGLSPKAAALKAAQMRLRPIFMTSMTTALGMLPIALGFGEGGRILQPLGIAVIGGLGFSMLTTLFIVPSLQVSYLEWKQRRTKPTPSTRIDDDVDDLRGIPLIQVHPHPPEIMQ